MKYLQERTSHQVNLPANSLERRVSAHYLEVNRIYGAEMLKRWYAKRREYISERNNAPEEEVVLTYADPSYEYEPRLRPRYELE
jgi:hypothetical protein